MRVVPPSGPLPSGVPVTVSAAEIEQAKQFMPSARTMAYISAPSAAIMIVLFTCFGALFYMLAGKLTGNAIRFKQGFALWAWAGMPLLLSALIGVVGVFTMVPQTAMESLMLTHLDPLLFELPLDSAWSGLAKGFDLLLLWAVGLVALGWRVWNRSSWAQAVIVASLPALLFYGIWAAFALAK